MADEYYEISPKLDDIDFYIGSSNASSTTFVTLDVEVSATKILTASCSIAIESSWQSTFLRKLVSASASASIVLSEDTATFEILNVLTAVHIQSSLTSQTSKTTSFSASISISSDVSVSCQKTTSFISEAHITSSVIPHVMKITKASSQSSISISSDFTAKFISFIRENLIINSRLNINAPIRFSPSYIDDTSIRTLFTLDDKPLTNHNRQFETSLSPLFIENKNWNNRSNRYYKRATGSGRRTFTISWAMLPNAMSDTVDSRHGRDFLNSIAKDPDIHELKILNQDENGVTAYTETAYRVFVRSYSETLIRRYIHQGVYLYDCSLTLEEA
jgi:hypothetical protein